MATFRDRLADRFKGLTGPTDELDKQITSLLERATSEMWISPDWSLNMELVDLINSNQNSSTYEKLFRAMRRRISKGNPKVQLLVLTVLETCAKNCGANFHVALGRAELWTDISRMADPKRKGDLQVKDRILVMVQDFAKSLQPRAFQKTLKDLQDQGVRFPERPDEEVGLGIDTAPPSTPGAARATGDVSEADRIAIQAALQELEATDRPHQGERGVTVLPSDDSHAVANTGNNPEKLMSDLKVARNTVDLLVDALGSIPSNDPRAVWQDFIRDLAQQCIEIKPRLTRLIESVVDEHVLGEALTLFEDLTKAQDRYDELAGAALQASQGGAQPRPAEATQLQRADTTASEDGAPTLVTNRKFLPPATQQTVAPPNAIDLLTDTVGVPVQPVPSGNGAASTAPGPTSRFDRRRVHKTGHRGRTSGKHPSSSRCGRWIRSAGL